MGSVDDLHAGAGSLSRSEAEQRGEQTLWKKNHEQQHSTYHNCVWQTHHRPLADDSHILGAAQKQWQHPASSASSNDMAMTWQ